MPGRILAELKQANPLSLEAEAALNLQRTADRVAARIGSVLKTADLSGSQYNVLRILRGAGSNGLACREIADRMVTRDPDITRLLDRLERRHLIERSRENKDRRVVTVRITPAGAGLLEELDEPVERELKSRLGVLGAQRLRELIEVLELVREIV